ncbi:hypothetical protein BAE31_06210 [Bacillus sp. I-2]|nr:hypothetical protein BAE31_06210 [Bacillus sp. I-2]
MDYKKCTCDNCGTIFIVKYCSRIMKVGRGNKRHLLVVHGVKRGTHPTTLTLKSGHYITAASKYVEVKQK